MITVDSSTPKIPDDLVELSANLDKRLKEWLFANYPVGMVIRWINGPFKGRLCRVRKAIFINEPDGSMSVGLRVETRRASGAGFVNRNDNFHRTYHDANYFFEKYELKGYDSDLSDMVPDCGEDIG